MSEDTNSLARYKKSMDGRLERLEAEVKAIRPGALLPDADEINALVQMGKVFMGKAIALVDDVQETFDGLKEQGGIEISVTPQGPTQVSVPTVTINVPLRGAKP